VIISILIHHFRHSVGQAGHKGFLVQTSGFSGHQIPPLPGQVAESLVPTPALLPGLLLTLSLSPPLPVRVRVPFLQPHSGVRRGHSDNARPVVWSRPSPRCVLPPSPLMSFHPYPPALVQCGVTTSTIGREKTTETTSLKPPRPAWIGIDGPVISP